MSTFNPSSKTSSRTSNNEKFTLVNHRKKGRGMKKGSWRDEQGRNDSTGPSPDGKENTSVNSTSVPSALPPHACSSTTEQPNSKPSSSTTFPQESTLKVTVSSMSAHSNANTTVPMQREPDSTNLSYTPNCTSELQGTISNNKPPTPEVDIPKISKQSSSNTVTSNIPEPLGSTTQLPTSENAMVVSLVDSSLPSTSTSSSLKPHAATALPVTSTVQDEQPHNSVAKKYSKEQYVSQNVSNGNNPGEDSDVESNTNATYTTQSDFKDSIVSVIQGGSDSDSLNNEWKKRIKPKTSDSEITSNNQERESTGHNKSRNNFAERRHYQNGYHNTPRQSQPEEIRKNQATTLRYRHEGRTSLCENGSDRSQRQMNPRNGTQTFVPRRGKYYQNLTGNGIETYPSQKQNGIYGNNEYHHHNYGRNERNGQHNYGSYKQSPQIITVPLYPTDSFSFPSSNQQMNFSSKNIDSVMKSNTPINPIPYMPPVNPQNMFYPDLYNSHNYLYVMPNVPDTNTGTLPTLHYPMPNSDESNQTNIEATQSLLQSQYTTVEVSEDAPENEVQLTIDSNFAESDTGILKELICPLCQQYMLPPINICTYGHAACTDCRVEFNKCYVCNVLYSVNVPILENIVRHFTFPCRNFEKGCLENLPADEMAKHENVCDKGNWTECPAKHFLGLNCVWRGVYNQLKNHLQECHKSSITRTVMYHTSDWRPQTIFLSAHGQLFIYHKNIHSTLSITDPTTNTKSEKNIWHSFLQHIGPQELTHQYQARFKVYVGYQEREWAPDSFVQAFNIRTTLSAVFRSMKTLWADENVYKKNLDLNKIIYMDIKKVHHI